MRISYVGEDVGSPSLPTLKKIAAMERKEAVDFIDNRKDAFAYYERIKNAVVSNGGYQELSDNELEWLHRYVKIYQKAAYEIGMRMGEGGGIRMAEIMDVRAYEVETEIKERKLSQDPSTGASKSSSPYRPPEPESGKEPASALASVGIGVAALAVIAVLYFVMKKK